jgi:hypothetical protein
MLSSYTTNAQRVFSTKSHYCGGNRNKEIEINELIQGYSNEVNYKLLSVLNKSDTLKLQPTTHTWPRRERICAFEFNSKSSDYLLNLLVNCYESRSIINNPDSTDIIHEFNRFITKLYEYEKVTNNNGFNIGVRCLTEGPAYADWCKKALIYSLINNFSIEPETDKKEYGYPDKYQDIYPYSHLFPWLEKDPMDIVNVMVKPTVKADELAIFKDKLAELVKDIIIEPIPDEIILSEGGASVCDAPEKYRGYAQAKRRTKVIYSRRLKGRRSVIRVGNANLRDSIILEPESSNSISKISKLTRQIVSKLKDSAMRRTNVFPEMDRATKRLKKEDFGSYIRDYKKCGLTLPTELLVATKEVLQDRYPGYGFDLMDVYSCIEITADKNINSIKKGEKIPFLRGHGLGMANELTTLIQCVISSMVRARVLNKLDLDIHSYNDDFRCIGHISDLIAYREVDIQVNTDLGLEVHPDKTRILRGASVFLEEYTVPEDYDYDKSILTYLTIIDQFFACNIVQAKDVIRSLGLKTFIRTPKEELILGALKRVKEFWGYEFHPVESNLPSTFGGWIDLKQYFTHDDLIAGDIESIDPNLLYKLACAEATERKGILLKEYNPKRLNIPSKKFKHHRSNIQIRSLTRFSSMLTGDIQERLSQLWKGLSFKSQKSQEYVRFQEERKDTFLSIPKKEYSFLNVVNKVIELYPSRSFTIPKIFCTLSGCNVILQDLRSLDPYSSVYQRDTKSRLDLEWRFIYNETVSKEDWAKILLISEFFEQVNINSTLPAVVNKILNKKGQRYYPNYISAQTAYYYKFGNMIPIDFHPDLKLIDKYDELGIPEGTIEFIEELLKEYPTQLSREEVTDLEQIISYYNIDRFDLYRLIRDFFKLKPDNIKLKIKFSFTEPCFSYEEIKKEEEFSYNDIEFDVPIPDITIGVKETYEARNLEIIIPDFEQIDLLESEEEDSAWPEDEIYDFSIYQDENSYNQMDIEYDDIIPIDSQSLDNG